MHRLWPPDAAATLDDDALVSLYQTAGPTLRMNFVTSADGAVEVGGYSRGLQTAADNRVFAMLRQFADGVLVGAGTLRHEEYGGLTLDAKRRGWRAVQGLDPYPRLVVVSRRLTLLPDHPALAQATVRPIVITSDRAPAAPRATLARVADILTCGDEEVDLAAAVAQLRARGLSHVLCEGGPHLFGSLTAADVVDDLCLTVAPMLAGAGAGRITAGTPSPVRGLALRHVVGDDDGTLLLRYTRNPAARGSSDSIGNA